MNELESTIRKYRTIARFFDALIILSIAIFFIWQLSPTFRAIVSIAIARISSISL